MINIERIKQIKDLTADGRIIKGSDFNALPKIGIQKDGNIDPLNYAIYTEAGEDYFFVADRTNDFGYRIFFEYVENFYSPYLDKEVEVTFSVNYMVNLCINVKPDAIRTIEIKFYDDLCEEWVHTSEENEFYWHMYKKRSPDERRLKFLSDGISLNDHFDPDGVIQDYWRLGSYEEEKLLSDFPIFQKQEAA